MRASALVQDRSPLSGHATHPLFKEGDASESGPLRPGKRVRALGLVERLGLLPPLRRVHDRRRASLLVLAYHRVVPVGRLEDYPLDPELISATPSEFAWQMEELVQNREPVSLERVVDALDGKGSLPANSVAVTFDDGSGDIHQHAFPVLRRLGIPATVFATTGYLDSGDPFWFELAAHLMMRVAPHAITLTEHERALPYGEALGARRDSLRILHRLMKEMPDDRRAIVVADWRQRFGDLLGSGAPELLRPLTWAQAQEMAAAGVEFGGHSVTHPNLTRLGDAELAWELRESRRVLQSRLGLPVRTIAYPIGTREAYDERVVGAVEAAGYRLGVTYMPGVNWMPLTTRFEVVRHGITLGTSRRYFRALLALPGWAA